MPALRMAAPGGVSRLRHQRGFTLIELMVALFALSLLAIMSWRGLDGMTRAQQQTATRADEVLTLQVALSQWSSDLDALQQLPHVNALDWNGRVLRMTRRSAAAPPEQTDSAAAMAAASSVGIHVVAWTRRGTEGAGTWLRWQSPPLTTRAQVDEAWQKADIWAQNPGVDERRLEVAILPLAGWQIFYYRSDAWTNPMSSDAQGLGSPPPPSGSPGAPGQPGQPGVPGQPEQPGSPTIAVLPDGVRLVLSLPAGHAITGVITRDWVRPTNGGGRS